MNISLQLEPIVGLSVANFRLIAGGSLILFFEQKHSVSGLAEWTLHIYSAWRLEQKGKPLIGSLDSCVNTKEEAEPFLALLRQLLNRVIEEITIGENVKDISLCLSSGYHLTTFSHSLDGESWVLRCKDGRRIGMSEKDITKLRDWVVNTDGIET